jgi:outer membrane protein assembly factor BamB
MALIADIGDMQPVWKSEKLPPSRPCTVAGNQGCGQISGSYSSAVVANGRVYFAYYEPTGTVRDNSFANPEKGLIDASDILLCIDAVTGERKWKIVFEGEGLNWNGFAKSGPDMTPTVWEGKVYFRGTMGKVYCVDGDDGTVVWESDIGRRYDAMKEYKQNSLNAAEMPQFNRDFLNHVIVHDNVAIINNQVWHKLLCAGPYTKGSSGWIFRYDETNGLLAFDATTGDTLWEMIRGTHGQINDPVLWSHDGTDYVAAAGYQGLVQCRKLKTGEVVWKEDCINKGKAE